MRILLTLLALCLALGACGKKAPLKTPPSPGDKPPGQESLIK